MQRFLLRGFAILSATSAAFYGFAFLVFFTAGCLGNVPKGDCDQARLAMHTASAFCWMAQWGMAAAFCMSVESYVADCADND